jgi:hypothetical protein
MYMNKYQVLNAFENFNEGDIVSLNGRQAKYRLLSGHIIPADAEVTEDVGLAEVIEPFDSAQGEPLDQ